MDKKSFTSLNFDQISVLFSFVDLETFLLFSIISKKVREITHGQKYITEKFWKQMFITEFCHPPEHFPDFTILENETNFERFKRAFKQYHEMRQLTRELVNETIRNTEGQQEEIREYLSPKSSEGRECNPIIASTAHVTFEFICFYKNWTDVAHFTNLNNLTQFGSIKEGYKVARMFKVYQTQFFDQKFQTLILSAPGVGIMQYMAKSHWNLEVLPFMHVKGSPRVIHIDYNNQFGFGHRAVLKASIDLRKTMVMASSITQFLQDHVQKLKQNWYMNLRGNIETYAMNPTDPKAYGSVTISSGVKITAVGYYNHLISEFDSVRDPINKKDNYVFSYQIRISDDPDTEVFYQCILETRSWIIQKGPNHTEEVRNQPGVIGKYPVLSKGMKPFIYESQCPTHSIGTKMEGHFTFRYIEGPLKDTKFNAKISEFTFRLGENQHLVESPQYVIKQQDDLFNDE